MRVTLLGTGCPVVDTHRYGPAALIEVSAEDTANNNRVSAQEPANNNQRSAGDTPEQNMPPSDGPAWLVDCGSGVTQRLLAHGRPGARLTGLLLTHLHSDHTVDLMQLLISGWHQGRAAPLRVYGPRGTAAFLGAIRAAWQPELNQRMAHEHRGPDGLELDITEISGGWTLEEDGLRITSTEVRHQPVPQAFGFRFDHTLTGTSAVISGDTAFSPELIALAQGCDLLVHETFVHWAFDAQRAHLPRETRENVRAYHTTGPEVGRVAAECGAGHLALTHFVPPRFDAARLLDDIRAHYGGPVSIGSDLMCLAVEGGGARLLREGLGAPP